MTKENDQAVGDEAERCHAAAVDAIMRSVAELLSSFTPEEIAEGAVKGAAVALMRGTGCTVFDVADVMAGFAEGFSNIPESPRDNFRVVK